MPIVEDDSPNFNAMVEVIGHGRASTLKRLLGGGGKERGLKC